MTQERVAQPANLALPDVMLGWLAFHRDALRAKCAGRTDEELVEASIPPSTLSLLGLVRHMTEMEAVYARWPLIGGELSWVYCTDEDPAADIEGLTAGQAADSLRTWHEIGLQVDHLIAGCPDWTAASPGNGHSLNWNLLKLAQEYARHSGHADLLRERIDGLTGE
jgi:Protein of unknown function (DUF664)